LLKNYATFKIGGEAKYFFVAKTKKDLILAITVAKKLKIPFFILGGGSNLLASDQGYKGLVIKIKNEKFKIKNYNSKLKIFCEAGAPLSKLLSESFKNGVTGLEWAAGIPGTVGGAVWGNAGAFGKSMRDIIKEVEVFDTKTEEMSVFKNKDCQFGYRDSIFKKNKNLIITFLTLKLKKGKKKEIQKKIKEYLNYKKEKQPLNYPSAGSIFKNLPRTETEFLVRGQKSPKQNKFATGQAKIKNRASIYGSEGEEENGVLFAYQNLLKKYPEFKKFNKIGEIPVGCLIDKCGLKGKKIGEAQISKIHANFIVNRNRAKAKDVKKLINLMKKKVKQKFGLVLKEEIEYL